jgi:hypothetical protein
VGSFGRLLGELHLLSPGSGHPSNAAAMARSADGPETSLSPPATDHSPMTDQSRDATILAVVHEDEGDGVLARAVELARESGAGVILWDADAGKHLLEDPLPNQWSAHGEEEQFGDRLTVNDLEAAGRAPLARQVAWVEAQGVDAWGWLPSSQDVDDLRAYAAAQHVETVVLGGDRDLGRDLRPTDLRVEVVTAGARSR